MTARITNQTLRAAADVLETLGTDRHIDRRAQIEAMQTLLAFTSVLRSDDPAAAADLQDAATALKRSARVRAAAASAVFDIVIEE